MGRDAIAGSVRPAEALAAFVGETSGGEWVLYRGRPRTAWYWSSGVLVSGVGM